MEEIIKKTKSIYNHPLALKRLMDDKISDDAYAQWKRVIRELHKSSGLKVINTTSAILPCFSCKIILEAEITSRNTFVERGITLQKSIISPYFCLFGTFACVESPKGEKVYHKKSLILNDVGEYEKYNTIIKDTLSKVLKIENVLVDIVKSSSEVITLDNKLNYVGNSSTLYNHLFGSLDLDSYHIIQ